MSDAAIDAICEGDGVIEFVDATVIRIRYDRTEDEEFVAFEDSVKEYHIPKFRKTNQSTTIESSFSSGVGSDSPLGVILPIIISPGST